MNIPVSFHFLFFPALSMIPDKELNDDSRCQVRIKNPKENLAFWPGKPGEVPPVAQRMCDTKTPTYFFFNIFL